MVLWLGLDTFTAQGSENRKVIEIKPSTGLYLISPFQVFGLPRWCSGKETACQCRSCKRHGFNPWVRQIPWGRKWQPTPVFLPGKSHRDLWSLEGYSPWGCKESDTAERACTHTQISDKHPTFQKVWLAGELKNSMSESMWVQSLVRELRSCKLHSAPKKEKKGIPVR